MRISHEFILSIDQTNAGIRLDKALSLHPEIESRSQASRLVAWGLVTIDGNIAKASRETAAGENYLVKFPEKEIKELLPYDFQLKILFEDSDVIVIDKPPGLVVHPAAGHHNDTLVNALLHHTNDLASGFEANRPGIVHRLDKDTSGIIVVAKNDHSHRKLALQFKNKTVRRIYWAIVFGQLPQKTDRIQSYLKRHPSQRLKFASEKIATGEAHTGKLAITDYKVLGAAEGPISLVELKLQTGRTHQIRVHLSELGNFILGDSIYGSSRTLKPSRQIDRLMLHARSLGFTHPRTEEVLNFQSTGEDFGFNPNKFGFDV